MTYIFLDVTKLNKAVLYLPLTPDVYLAHIIRLRHNFSAYFVNDYSTGKFPQNTSETHKNCSVLETLHECSMSHILQQPEESLVIGAVEVPFYGAVR